MKTYTALAFIVALLTTPASIQSQEFRLHQVTFTSGGGHSTSTSMQMTSTLGQVVTAADTSPSFALGKGFWYQYQALKIFYLYAFQVDEGWNMISLPRTVSNPQVKVLFPTALSKAFSYSGGYVPQDTVVPGTGYWLKFPAAEFVSFLGTARNQDTITVNANWNLIGSISQPVSTSDIFQIPPGNVVSNYFEYAGAYNITDSIRPGKAYWVRTTAGGSLVLGSSGSSSEKPAVASALFEQMNVLTVSTRGEGKSSSGKSARLYFGTSSNDVVRTTDFSLPPAPPEGAFDARFASNRFAEVFPVTLSERRELPLQIQSGGGSLRLAWEIKPTDNIKYTLIECVGKKIVRQSWLRGDGEIEVEPAKTYAVRAERMPTAYRLLQNYPNPFNSSTTIRYELPVNSRVKFTVYDILGHIVGVLVDGTQEAGSAEVMWDAGNYASGVYFFRLSATSLTEPAKAFSEAKKMIVLK